MDYDFFFTIDSDKWIKLTLVVQAFVEPQENSESLVVVMTVYNV